MPVRSRILKAAHGRFGYLLVALLALIVTAPVATEGPLAGLLLSLLESSVLVAGLYVARPETRSLWLGAIVAMIDLGVGILANLSPEPWIFLLQASLWLVTLFFVTMIILEVVLASQNVTLETLQAAFCVFLLLGLTWAYFYICANLIEPGSFDSPDGFHLAWGDTPSRRKGFLRFLIFSYSRMVSSSYAGLTPVTNFASICCCLEAMMSQIYLAVVIARLVGIQVRQAGRPNATAA